ncbi:MAG: transglutaminase-like domain-containing protein [Rhodospirillales bacterium]|nr:transglutaminase-like domain-containing protein [Rhodospirillales bacterium]
MTLRDTLIHLGAQPDDQIILAETALMLALWAEPTLELGPYHRHLQALSEDAQNYLHDDDASVLLSAEAARQIIHRRYGYTGILQPGDPGEQGDGANLARTIDKRRGGAMALGILYHHVFTALGLIVEILDFPARPLVRIEDKHGQRLVLDPVDGGRSIDARGLRELYRHYRGGDGALDPFSLSSLNQRDVLIALQDQIKVHHLRLAAPEAALAALEAALLIAPNHARLWREAGLLHARLDHVGDAIAALRHFLDLPGGEAHRYTVSQLLQQLQNREDKKPS